MRKRVLAVLMSVLCLFGLSGCDGITLNIDQLIMPPSPAGNLGLIQKALYAFAGNEITLRYPKGGDYRSAFVLYDLNHDGSEEALAFYSTVTEENANMMHVNFIKKEGETWCSASDYAVEAGAIGSVTFADLDGDKADEVLIGFTVSTSSSDKLSVLDFADAELTPVLTEEYTVCLPVDLRGAGQNDLLLISRDMTARTATAKLFSFRNGEAILCGTCPLDGSVEGYGQPIVSQTSSGQPAVYVDGSKGTEGTVTEIVMWENGGLVNPFVGSQSALNVATLRTTADPMGDVNGDGQIEIPRLLMPVLSPENDRAVPLTEWLQFDGETLMGVQYDLINRADGYTVTLPPDLAAAVAIIKTDRERLFFSYDDKTKTIGESVLTLRSVPTSSGETDDTWFSVLETPQRTVMAKLNAENEFGLTEEAVKKAVKAAE